MSIPEKSILFPRSLMSIMLMVLFLVLSFCPLRNALCSLANHSPKKTEQKATADLKTILQETCTQYSADKIIPFTESVSKASPLALMAVIAIVFFAGILLLANTAVRLPETAAVSLNPVPIYLQNRALLI